MTKLFVAAAFLASFGFAEAQTDPALSVSQLQFQPEGTGVGHIVGIAHNNTDHALSFAMIQFNLYDSQGALVGNAVAAAQNLAPDQDWRFDAETAERFARYRVSGIKAVP